MYLRKTKKEGRDNAVLQMYTPKSKNEGCAHKGYSHKTYKGCGHAGSSTRRV